MSHGTLIIIGAGGHAKVVASAAIVHAGEMPYIFDSHATQESLLSQPVHSQLPEHNEPASSDYRAIIAIGDNATRKQVAHEYAELNYTALIHPAAHVDAAAGIGEGSFIGCRAVLHPDTVIGAHVIVNTGAIIEHDCRVGDYSHIAPGAILTGAVTVGQGCLIGANATLMPGVTIGDGCVVGAGAMVHRDVPDNRVVKGVPAL